MLKTKKALTPNQVDAATKVVAASLGSWLRITIVDHNLNLLSRDYEQTDLIKVSTQMKCDAKDSFLNWKTRYMTSLRSELPRTNFLDTMSVSANAVLDFDTLKAHQQNIPVQLRTRMHFNEETLGNL